MTGIGLAGIGALIGLFVGVSVVWEFTHRWRMPRREQRLRQEIDERYETYRKAIMQDHAAEIGRLEQVIRVARERARREEQEKIAAGRAVMKQRSRAELLQKKLRAMRSWEARNRHKGKQAAKKEL